MSFINSFFLIAGVVALLPIIYHLIKKLRVRKIKFGSLLFLKATPKELVKRRRLQDLILLIVRCTILALLAFAFARPFIPQEKIAFIKKVPDKSMVLLMDLSFSMKYGNFFERARAEALDRIAAAGSSDEISIVVFSDEAIQLSQLNNEFQIHKNIVENSLALSNRKTDFYKPLRLAEEILKNARHETREIILISDLQANGMNRQFENWKVDPTIQVIPVKIAEEKQNNVYFKKFNLKRQRTGKTMAVQYGVQIDAVGERDIQIEKVALLVNEKIVDIQEKELSDNNQVFFQQRDLKEGVYLGYVNLSEDKLEIDNNYYFNMDVAPQLSIYCIDGSLPAIRSNRFYLQNCFNIGTQSLYRFSSGAINTLFYDEIQKHRVLFLTNLNSLSAQNVTAIKNYLNGGGNVIISFGNKTNLDKFSNHLKSLGIGNIVEKVNVRDRQSSSALFSEVDLKHPIFEIFAKTGTSDIFQPKFRNYLKVVTDSATSILGKFDSGDPFLIEKKFGPGKILVFTSTFNTEWGDFPVNEIYLPFVYQLVKYALSSAADQNSFKVGETIVFRGKEGEKWEINGPEDTIYKLEIEKNGLGYFRETESPGNYRATGKDRDYYFSVNVDEVESDLASFDVEEFYSAITQPVIDFEERNLPGKVDNIGEEESRQKLWRLILILLVFLFLFETFYANRKIKRVSSY